ncbi:hypothetical protein B0T17DRAFT_489190 [Bombardia bombarda]|uniref:Peroxin 20 n=1 Tax=Bombardia bombarda TaxID=252184 RepID=A0AA39X7P4_9PEZI|nr:hypothetical protein B0T17DRAFT_489190 [Bombardia bombarda]
MADNMCGPSNGAKSLIAHTDRDRALHQDRLTNNSPAGGASASFRSQPAFSNTADNAFQNFQQGQAPLQPMAPMPFAQGVQHARQAILRPVPSGMPAAMHASAGSSTTTRRDWVDEFATMHVGSSAAVATAAAAPSSMFVMNPLRPVGMALHQAPMGFGAAVPSYAMQHAGGSGLSMYSSAANVQQQFDTPQQQQRIESALDVEAFNRAFGEYDEADFEQELASWDQERGEEVDAKARAATAAADQELADAQDAWMAEHGPHVQPPTAEEMTVIDADLEELARELEQRQAAGDPEVLPARSRRQNGELAAAAGGIVNSVAGDQSEKFRKSNFLEFMRRVASGDVVVEGTDFVDAETGEKVAPKEAEEGGVEGEGVVVDGDGQRLQ